jgi:adenylosuccinate lyase
MPHKRNPILSENLTGLARLVRAAVTPALENVTLWHERDISHSAVERNIAPDATVTLDFALARLTNIIENLIVYPDRMRENLDRSGGLIFSQRVLLALTQAGMSREESYRIVQTAAMQVWDSQGKKTLRDCLESQEMIRSHLSSEALDTLFDERYFTRNLPDIFKRCFDPKK